MLRKFCLILVMSILLMAAMAAHTPLPVVVVMGILSFFMVSASSNRREIKEEKSK